VSEIRSASASFRDDGAAITVPDQHDVVEAEVIKRVSDVASIVVQSAKRPNRCSVTREVDGVRGDPSEVEFSLQGCPTPGAVPSAMNKDNGTSVWHVWMLAQRASVDRLSERERSDGVER